MKASSVLFFAFPIILFLSSGNFVKQSNASSDFMLLKSAEYDLIISKTADNTWSLTNPADSSSSDITVKPGDTVKWTAEGSDVFFQFSSAKIFGKSNYNLLNGKSLSLVVSSSAPAGTFSYSIFCSADSQFVDPNSPPRIIVPRN